MAEQLPDETLETILDAGAWEFGDFEFAGGQHANNKFFMERVLRVPFETEVMHVMGKAALQYEPDVLLGVPSGGSLFAERLAESLNCSEDSKKVVRVAKMVKQTNEPDIKSYDFATEDDEKMVLEAENLVIVEDITNRLTSISGMLGNLVIRSKARAAVAAMARAPESPDRKKLCVPVIELVREEVPDIITPKHPFFEAYAKRAVNSHRLAA